MGTWLACSGPRSRRWADAVHAARVPRRPHRARTTPQPRFRDLPQCRPGVPGRGIVPPCDSRSSRRSNRCSPRPSDALPEGDGWLFEPKWDGFRALVFRDGDEVYTQSRDLKPLDRYFPELAAPFLAPAAGALRARRRGRHRARRRPGLRGAAAADPPGRVAGRACSPRRAPASFVAWDLLALGDEDLRAVPAGRAPGPARGGPGAASSPPVHLTPATPDRALAADWFDRFEGAGLDGVVAKRLDERVPARQAGDAQDQARAHGRLRGGRASAGTRTGPGRTSARCCSACSTTRARSTTSGITSSFTWERRAALVEELAPLRENALDGHPGPSGPSGRPGTPTASGQRLPGRRLALEPRQGPVVGAAARGARRRGRLRPPPGRPLPPRDDVPALAPGQGTGGLPLRPARGRPRRSSWRGSSAAADRT